MKLGLLYSQGKDRYSDRSQEWVPKSAFGRVEKELRRRCRILIVGSFILFELLSPYIVSVLSGKKRAKIQTEPHLQIQKRTDKLKGRGEAKMLSYRNRK
jgi:hypothetical protein